MQLTWQPPDAESPSLLPGFVYHAALQNGDTHAGGRDEPDSGPEPVADPIAAPRYDARLRRRRVFLRNAQTWPTAASDPDAADVAARGASDREFTAAVGGRG